MRQIDDDAEPIHALDRLASERREPAVDFARVTATVVAVFAERQGQTAQTQIEEGIEQSQAIAQRLGILQTEQHANLAAIAGSIEARLTAQNVRLGMLAHNRLDGFKVLDALQSVIPRENGGAADHRNAL